MAEFETFLKNFFGDCPPNETGTAAMCAAVCQMFDKAHCYKTKLLDQNMNPTGMFRVVIDLKDGSHTECEFKNIYWDMFTIPDAANHQEERRLVTAVDFDGTLFTDAWPNIGEPIWPIINYIKKRQAEGRIIKFNTNRSGEPLAHAICACHSVGIDFDAINENLPGEIERFGNDCRKLIADEYIDDKAVTPKMIMDALKPEPPKFQWISVEEQTPKDGDSKSYLVKVDFPGIGVAKHPALAIFYRGHWYLEGIISRPIEKYLDGARVIAWANPRLVNV